MSTAAKDFFAAAGKDASIQAQLKGAKSSQDVSAIAAGHGYRFTAGELDSLPVNVKEGELQESQLAGVVGGMKMSCSCSGCSYTSYAVQCITCE